MARPLQAQWQARHLRQPEVERSLRCSADVHAASAYASTSQVPMDADEGREYECVWAKEARGQATSCTAIENDSAAMLEAQSLKSADQEHLGPVSTHRHSRGRLQSSAPRRPTRLWRAPARQSSSPLPLLLVLCALLALLARPATASIGDRSPEYRLCVDSCDRDSCLVPPDWDDGIAHATRLPWILRVTRWTCIDDCRYHCTHRVTNEAHDRVTHIREETMAEVESQAVVNGWSRAQQRTLMDAKVQARLEQLRPVQKQMVQYHGKWVFIRFLGAQEPLSVLFSVMNLYVHIRGLGQLRKQVPDCFPLKLVYILHALLSCLAWLASAVFHARDKPVTERLDYFFAGAVILGGLFYTICRLFRIKPSSRSFKLIAQGMGMAYGLHVLYLCIGRFDYAYNMQANILVAICHSLLWLVYSINPQFYTFAGPDGGRLRSPGAAALHTTAPRLHSNGGSPPVPVSTPVAIPPSSSRKARHGLQKILALLWLASALEVFDFAPLYRALDAHALWHLATVPIARMWYSWLIEDARECVSSGFWAADMDGLTAKYLQLPHKTEAAVENVGRVVGPPMMRAMEKARELIETAAGKSSDAMAATGTSSGIEFKALTNKLNEFARSTLGNQSSAYGNHQSSDSLMQAHHRSLSTANGTAGVKSDGTNCINGSSGGGGMSSDEEVPMGVPGPHSMASVNGAGAKQYVHRGATGYSSSGDSACSTGLGTGVDGLYTGSHAPPSARFEREK